MMDLMTLEELGEPVFREDGALRLVGLAAEYTMEQVGLIPQQWIRFERELREVGAAPGGESFGVVLGERGRPMRYVSAVGALDLEGLGVTPLPADWETVEIPGQHYAVFAADGPVALMQRMWPTIWRVWLGESGRKVRQGPMLEWYAAGYDAAAGGRFEIRVPVER